METMDDYKDELEASFRRINEGDIISGTVIDVNEEEVTLDLKYYAQGIIKVADLSNDPDFNVMEQVHKGDVIEATVVQTDDGAGNIVLSKKEANDILAWDKLKQMMEDETTVKVRIKESVPSGVVTYLVQMGIPKENIVISDIGKVIELTKKSIKITDEVPSGKVFVDGLGVGDVGSIVLRDRKHLSEDGIIIVAITMDKESGDILSGPELISRGFVYVRESEQLLDNARNVVNRSLDYCYDNNITDWSSIKNEVRDSLSRFLYQKTRRSPMILPVIMQI